MAHYVSDEGELKREEVNEIGKNKESGRGELVDKAIAVRDFIGSLEPHYDPTIVSMYAKAIEITKALKLEEARHDINEAKAEAGKLTHDRYWLHKPTGMREYRIEKIEAE